MQFKKIFATVVVAMALSACGDDSLPIDDFSIINSDDPVKLYEAGKDYFSGSSGIFDRDKAIELFTKSADLDYPQAEYMIATLYMTGNSVKKDLQKATKYYKKAADHGITEAQIKLSETLYKNNGLMVSLDEAIEYLQDAAKSDPRSMTMLAKHYMHGVGVQEDYKKAETLLQKAASYKEPEALVILAEMYFVGAPGILQDNYKGLNFLKIALNDPNSSDKSRVYYAYGKVYLYGRGYPVDEAKAMDYFTKAGEGGLVDAQMFLANRYWNQPDYKRALYWYNKAGLQNNVAAQLKLATIYQEGLDVEPNLKEAISWNEKAAMNGSEQARYNLILLYADSDGNKDKLDKIVMELEDHANKGDRVALSKLFYLYAGQGKFQDQAKAEQYLQKIADQGDLTLLTSIADDYIAGKNHLAQNKANGFSLLLYVATRSSENNIRIRVGDLYKEGNVVNKDLYKAYAWYNIDLAKNNRADTKKKIKALKFSKKDLKNAIHETDVLKKTLAENSNENIPLPKLEF